MSVCAAKCLKVINVNDDRLACCECKANFHQGCSGVALSLCKELIKNPTSAVKFSCIKCQASLNVKNQLQKIMDMIASVNDKIDKNQKGNETRLTNLEEKREEKKEEEEIVIDSAGESWSKVVKKNKRKPVVLVVPKDKNQNRDSTKASVKNAINPTNFIVRGMKNASKNGVIIPCDDDVACDKFLAEAEDKLGENFHIKKPEKKLPRIKILRVYDPATSDEEFLKNLKAQNPEIANDSVEVIRRETLKSKGETRTDCVNFVLQVDGATFNKIMKAKSLTYGWNDCKVVDNIYIRRCYNCYGFNHNAAQCHNKQVCSKCGSNDHKFKECQAVEEKCVNCVKINLKLKMNLDVNHNIWSQACKVYQHKLEISKRSIQYID